ncbi:hypothetical protein PIB30_025378 [Stylosanthes scabra]|uniref:Uncharacterized protein n=1 Tax=Stylosanthes scabra TaxID=79078 RepID=A0ABU6Z8M5_9FABA|nr:hypothetical protein [Stylosanthes scabra]
MAKPSCMFPSPYELSDDLVTKVKDNGKRCLDARWRDQGSRVCIELGVQGKIINDRGRLIGPPGKYERWLSSASSGSVGIGYDNRPGELTVACSNRHASSAFD